MKAGLLGRKLGHSLSPQIHKFFGDYEYRLCPSCMAKLNDWLKGEQK